MSERLEAVIIARDQASQVFQKVGSAADTMGDDIQEAANKAKASGGQFDTLGDRVEAAQRELEELRREGEENQRELEELRRRAQDAGRGLDELGRDAEESTRSLRDMKEEARAIGAGIGVLIAGVSLAGQAFRDQEIALATLERRYGDAADELRAFADELQATTNFSNDQAVASANLAGTLAQSYGFTADQIRQLIQISADLAASSTTITGQQISLEDATQRVTAAMRGEAESAELLGLTLNDRALGIDRLAASTTDAEKAQIRWNALQEQSAFAMGAAAEQADTTYGRLTNLKHGINDAAQSFGEFSGVVGEAGAFLADNALQVGLATAGLTTLGNAALKARAMMAGFGLTLGPIGVALAAGSAIVGGLLWLRDALDKDIPQASEAAVESIETVQEAIIRLGEAGQLSGTQSAMATLINTLEGVVSANNELLNAAQGDWEDFFGTTLTAAEEFGQSFTLANGEVVQGISVLHERFEDLPPVIMEFLDANGDAIVSVDEARAAYENYGDALGVTAEQNRAFGATMNEAQSILTATGPAAIAAQQNYVALTNAFLDGKLTADEYILAVEETNSQMLATASAAAAAGDATLELSEQTQIAADNWNEMSVEAARAEAQMSAVELQEFRLTNQTEDTNEVLRDHSDLLRIVTDNYNIMSVAAAQFEGQQARGRAQIDILNAGLAETSVEAARAAAAMSDVELQEFNLTQLEEAEQAWRDIADAAEEAAQAVQSVSAATETGFRVIVGNTDAIAGQADAMAGWATEMRELGQDGQNLHTLLRDGRITLAEYGDAMRGVNTVLFESEQIQEAVLEIQAKQAPVIAELASAQKQYIDDIAELEGRQQLAALGFLDMAESQRALDLATAAASASTEQQVAAVEQMIEAAAVADPVLASMLEQMGLISIGADGTITVNTEGFGEAMSEFGELTEAIEGLTDTLHEIFIEADGSAAIEEINGVKDQLDIVHSTEAEPTIDADAGPFDAKHSTVSSSLSTLDETTVSPTVNLTDNASATLANISAHLDGLSGRSVTSYINVVQSFSGSSYSPLGGGQRTGHGGVIGNYAAGGVVAEMGEWGDELLRFPNGGVAMTQGRGLYAVPEGTYVTPAPASRQVTEQHHGDVIINVYPQGLTTQEVVYELMPVLQRAAEIHLRGHAS